MNGLFLIMLGCAAPWVAVWADEVPQQTPASFAAAILNDSTSPSYVLFTVVDATTESAHLTCTLAPLLRGAVHIEYALPYDAVGRAKEAEIVFANTEHVFRFNTPAALANIPIAYPQEAIARTRSAWATVSTTALQYMYSWHTNRPSAKDHTAEICALLERGLSPAMQDRTGALWLAALDEHPYHP